MPPFGCVSLFEYSVFIWVLERFRTKGIESGNKRRFFVQQILNKVGLLSDQAPGNYFGFRHYILLNILYFVPHQCQIVRESSV